FALLGLTPTSSLKIVALATDEGALRPWAAFPDKNPLTSPLVASASGQGRDYGSFALTQAYTFASLGSGIAPNGGKLPGADVQATVASDPGGIAAGFLADSIFDLIQPNA